MDSIIKSADTRGKETTVALSDSETSFLEREILIRCRETGTRNEITGAKVTIPAVEFRELSSAVEFREAPARYSDDLRVGWEEGDMCIYNWFTLLYSRI